MFSRSLSVHTLGTPENACELCLVIADRRPKQKLALVCMLHDVLIIVPELILKVADTPFSFRDARGLELGIRVCALLFTHSCGCIASALTEGTNTSLVGHVEFVIEVRGEVCIP